MNTIVFQPGYTWRRLGYILYSDSLSYREVLEANTEWDITSLPPPGTLLNGPSATGGGGGLMQANVITGSGYSNVDPDTYYPFSTRDEYIRSLIKYNASALRDVERYNGWSSTSNEVLTEIKLG